MYFHTSAAAHCQVPLSFGSSSVAPRHCRWKEARQEGLTAGSENQELLRHQHSYTDHLEFVRK